MCAVEIPARLICPLSQYDDVLTRTLSTSGTRCISGLWMTSRFVDDWTTSLTTSLIMDGCLHRGRLPGWLDPDVHSRVEQDPGNKQRTIKHVNIALISTVISSLDFSIGRLVGWTSMAPCSTVTLLATSNHGNQQNRRISATAGYKWHSVWIS